MAFVLFVISLFNLEIFMFLYYANEESDDVIIAPLKQKSTESRLFPVILEQCSSKFAQEMYQYFTNDT